MQRKKPCRYSNRLNYNDLISLESSYARSLFGPVPNGHRREFFKDKDNVWVWYEGWTNSVGNLEEMTVRYEVRPSGVFKLVSGGKYKKLKGPELDNFRNVAKGYLRLMKTKLYY